MMAVALRAEGLCGGAWYSPRWIYNGANWLRRGSYEYVGCSMG